MLDHVTISARGLRRAKESYDRALRPFGIECLYTEEDGFAGHGVGRKAFWIGHDGNRRASMSRSRRRTGRLWIASIKKLSKPAAWTTGHQASGHITTRTTTAPSFSILTVTTSKPSVTHRSTSFALRREDHEARWPSCAR